MSNINKLIEFKSNLKINMKVKYFRNSSNTS